MRWTLAIGVLFLLAASNAASATQTQTITPRIDIEDLKKLQQSVDGGHQPWRLDPVMTACSEIAYAEDVRTCWLESRIETLSDTTAIVGFAATRNHYVVYLQRLVRSDGIWTATSIATTPTDEDSGWLHYEPQVVTVRGRLMEITTHGPPNYGENPENDSIEYPVILVLTRPIRVQGDAGSELNTETLTNITQVQLVIPGNVAVDFPPHYEGEVEATGTLFHSHTGHHHTQVLMNVEMLAPATSR
jgi:hypothetical protein